MLLHLVRHLPGRPPEDLRGPRDHPAGGRQRRLQLLALHRLEELDPGPPLARRRRVGTGRGRFPLPAARCGKRKFLSHPGTSPGPRSCSGSFGRWGSSSAAASCRPRATSARSTPTFAWPRSTAPPPPAGGVEIRPRPGTTGRRPFPRTPRGSWGSRSRPTRPVPGWAGSCRR